MALELTGHWAIPSMIGTFIANTKSIEEDGRVLSWPTFK